MRRRDADHPVEHRADLDVLQRRDVEALDELGEVALERLHVDVGAAVVAAEHQHRLGEELRVVPREREQQDDQQLARLGPELADHAEVEQHDLLAGPQQVARVRIGVEEALDQHLLVERLEQLAPGLATLRAVDRLA